jgi:hypothetical protein
MLRLMFFLLLWPGLAFAEGGAGISGALRTQIVEGPERFEAFVAGLILGYGTAQGITAQGIEDFLAVERAKRRVRELRRMLLADLDDDGSVTQGELFVVMSAQGANARGTLWQSHSAADTDVDGNVTTKEMQNHARKLADRSAAADADIRALLGLDFDQNGFVSTLELRHAMTLISPET